jgi:hypothetical protein
MHRGNSVVRRRIATLERQLPQPLNRATGSCHGPDQANLRAAVRIVFDIQLMLLHSKVRDEICATFRLLGATALPVQQEQHRPAEMLQNTYRLPVPSEADCVAFAECRHVYRVHEMQDLAHQRQRVANPLSAQTASLCSQPSEASDSTPRAGNATD